MTLADRRDALQIIAIGSLPVMGAAAYMAHLQGEPPINLAVGVVAVVAVGAMLGWYRLSKFLEMWHAERRRRRRIARRYRLVRHTLSITCGCGTLAKPLPGTRDRYRCDGCSQQWATSPHRLRPLREYLCDADTPWPI